MALTMRAPKEILGRSERSRCYIVSGVSATSENEECRAEKIVDDSGSTPAPGNITTPGSGSQAQGRA